MRFLLVAALCGLALASLKPSDKQLVKDTKSDYSDEWDSAELERYDVHESIFRADREYRYRFDGQLSAGIPLDIADQHAITRVQALVTIQPKDGRTFYMQMERVRFGSSQQHEMEPRYLKPFDAFDNVDMDKEHERLLNLPLRFTYKNGMVSEIVFSENDQMWSENIKRAVLNMLQVDLLKQNKVEVERRHEVEKIGDKKEESWTGVERTLEGECQVTYIRMETEKGMQFSKSLNFTNCQERAESRQYMAMCEECETHNREEEKLSSSVMSMNLTGNHETYLINDVEIRSQHLFSKLNDKQKLLGSFVHNKLRLVYAGKKEKSIPEVRGEKKQTLLYNNQWEKMMEKFAQTGESKYLIKIVKNKVEHIVKLIDQMAGHLTKHIEQQAPHTLARTVKLLRICTEEELQQIDKHIFEKLSQMEQKTAEKVRSIYFNALGLAGTRNTIKHIAEKINKGQMEPIKGAQVLKSLIEMRYPSPQIVDEIQRICESDAAYRSPVLRQSCWLTYGAVINGVCTESSRIIRANRDERLCTREMKKSYTSKILGQMQKASNRYEKVLFMKVLANAGLDTSIVELEKIIYDRSETKTIRLQAIEATRRLIPMMPRKIQRLLMPIYRNRFEKTELRLSALHHLMLTEPDVTILSQIAEQFEQERSQQVRAFTFTCLKSWAESTNPCKESFSQSVARIVKRLEKTTVRPLDSRFAKWDMYSREYEAGWSASWASLFTNDSVLPNDVIASLDGLFGGHFSKNFFQVGFSQHNMDSLLAKLFNKIEETGLDEIIVRGKRAASESSFRPMEMLSNLYDRLRISRRGVNPSAAHGLLYIRHRDVDYAVVPFEQETLPEFIRNMFHNGRIEIAELERWLAQGGHFTWSSAAYVYESTRRVPTALGIPVEMSIKMPTVATVSGNVRMEVEPKNGEKFDGLRFKVIAHPSLATTHVNKIETFCPVVSIGVKILSNANLNTPINTEMLVNWHKKLTLKTMTKLPEQKEHIGHFSTRPVTFIRHMRPEMRQYPEPIEKTIVISEYQLPSHEVNREYFKMTGFSMQVQGTLRSPLFPTEVSVPKSVLIADNHLDIVVVPTSGAPKELNTITEIELFVPVDKFEQPRFEKYFEKTSRKQNEDLFETEDGDYLEEDEPTRRRAFDSYLKTFKTGKAYKHRMFVRAETERKEQFAEFEMIAQCDKEMKYCNAKVEAKRSPLMNDERRDWRMSGKVELLYPQTPKSLREMKEQQHRELQINGRFEWEGEQKQQWMNVRIQGEQSREQKAWMKAVETKMTRLSEIERLEEASRLNQYKVIVDYEMARETRYTWDKLFTLVKGFQWYYPLSSGYQLVDNQQGRVEARLTIEPRSRRFANLTVETPRERLSLSNLRMPFQLPTTKIYQSRSERSTLESRSSANRFFDRIVKQAECVVKSNKINTFDDVSYSAPITTCYSVLAKDCGSEKPAFAILMKKLTKTGGEKKLKIVTKKAVITAELELDNKEQMKITIDGKHIVKPEELEKYDIVREDSDVIRINNEHFMVVFDGYEVRIRINEIYRNRQCGICGHYDGETESEFRRADNYEYEENDLPKFMRSYLSEDEECQKDDETLNDSKKYGRMERRRSQSSWSDKWEVNSSEEEYEPYKAQSNEWDDESDEEYNDEEKPEKRTRVIERSNKICFSVEPVEECDDKSEEREMQKREVEFVCARRDNSQVRELMRLAKRRVVSQQQLEKLEDSQTQRIEIRYPTKCYAGRQ